MEVPLDADEKLDRDWAQIENRFHTLYEQHYTYCLDAPVEIVGFHLVAIAQIDKLIPAALAVTGRTLEAARKGHRVVDYATDGIHEAAIYDYALLEPQMCFDGPAIVEDAGTTVVVHPRNRVYVDRLGNLHITING